MPRNIVLLSIDALRMDHLSCYGYGANTTPCMDTLAEGGIRFTNAFSASSHTREAVPALLTGEYPDIAINEDFTLDADTLATDLSATHSTGAFHSNPYVSRAYEFHRDFDKFDDDMRFGWNRLLALGQRALDKFILNRGGYHARADEINKRSLDWLDSLGDEPFFLWNHYMDVHGPYNPPEDHTGHTNHHISDSEAQELYNRCVDDPKSLTGDERQLIMDLYDGEIRYTDAMIGKLLSALQTRELLEDTLVILTADHGEFLGENGRFAHPRILSDELIRIPLILRGPEVTSQVDNRSVSVLDIVPTVLNTLGHNTDDLPGEELLSETTPTDSERVVFSSALGEGHDAGFRRFTGRMQEWQYSITRDIKEGNVTEESILSPENQTYPSPESLDGSKKETAQRIRSSLLEHSAARIAADDRDEDSDETKPIVEKRLEALGYK